MTSAEDRPIVAAGGAVDAMDEPNGDYTAAAQETAEASVRKVRLTYASLLVIGFVLGVILKTTAFEWIAHWAIEKGGSCTSSSCVGNQSAYRVSFAMALFFLLHWALSTSWNLCMDSRMRIQFNQQHILIKLLMLIPLFLISFAIPNDFFVAFAWLCVALSVLFLIGQLLVLLEFTYEWSDNWSTKEEQRFVVGLLVCTVLMLGAGITFSALGFKYFGSNSSCQLNQAMLSITIVAAVLYLVGSAVTPKGSLLPAACVYLYTSYTCFSALLMTEPGECNLIESGHETAQLLIGTAFGALSLGYMSMNAASSREAFQLDTNVETEEDAEANAFAFFHLQMLLGSCYLAMLLTNWTIEGSNHLASMSSNAHTAPKWAKLSSEMVCILLYAWTVAAPVLFPHRFGGSAGSGVEQL